MWVEHEALSLQRIQEAQEEEEAKEKEETPEAKAQAKVCIQVIKVQSHKVVLQAQRSPGSVHRSLVQVQKDDVSRAQPVMVREKAPVARQGQTLSSACRRQQQGLRIARVGHLGPGGHQSRRLETAYRRPRTWRVGPAAGTRTIF